MLEAGGVMVIDFRIAAVTVTVAVPEMPPCLAVITGLPTFVADTRPSIPLLLLTPARLLSDELHLTKSVKSLVVPFEKLPVA
jgi:hypothetical protein